MASSEHHHHQHCHCHDGVCVGAHMMGPATGEGEGVAATESRDHSQTSAWCSTNVAPPTFTCLPFISSSIVMPPTNQRLANKIPKTISISAIILTIGRCGPASFFSHISSYYRAIVSQRGFDPCQIGTAACCSPIQPTSESNFAFVCQCE